MNDYVTLRVNMSPCNEDMTDLLAAFLCDIGYDSFEPDDKGLTAYISAKSFDEEAVREIFSDFPMDTQFSLNHELVKGEDWNAEWEKNYFNPIVIGGECVVHSSFHKDIPEATYDIVIDPKMAFGTGHHSTTSSMIRYILESDMDGKDVIDMGTGTGILAILAKKRGANKVIGIEIDTPAWQNAVENCGLNNVGVEMINGDASALTQCGEADYFFANINRNIILGDIDRYVAHLKKGGTLLLSGFYEADVPMLENAAKLLGLRLLEKKMNKEWCALRFIKE